jgi:hypothetical protein
MAVIAFLTHVEAGCPAAWGRSLDDGGLATARAAFDGVVHQDRSLARHVARDMVLMFEVSGGLLLGDALQGVGLDATVANGSASTESERAAVQALSVARTIQARSNGGEAAAADVAVYRALYEDRSAAGYLQAINIGAWAALVVARLATNGKLENGAMFLQSGRDSCGQMESVGWYPNPVNPGDTSMGDASIERWWDGSDWTERVRVREGRRWSDVQLTLFRMPPN